MIESKGEERGARSGRDFHIYIVSTQRHSAVIISNHGQYTLCNFILHCIFIFFFQSCQYRARVFFAYLAKSPMIPFTFLCFICSSQPSMVHDRVALSFLVWLVVCSSRYGDTSPNLTSSCPPPPPQTHTFSESL